MTNILNTPVEQLRNSDATLFGFQYPCQIVLAYCDLVLLIQCNYLYFTLCIAMWPNKNRPPDQDNTILSLSSNRQPAGSRRTSTAYYLTPKQIARIPFLEIH